MKKFKRKRISRNLEEIQLIANKYTKRSIFAKLDNAVYRAAKKRSDFEQIVAHMDPSATRAYTLEEIQLEANKHKRPSDFQKYSNGHYQAALKRDDYSQIIAHMDPSATRAYTLEEIQLEANKHTKRSKFKKANSSIYNAAWKRDDFEQIVAHMDTPINEAYTFEEIEEIVKKCKTKGELNEKYPSVYSIIIKRRDREKLMAHMPHHVDQSGENNPMYGRIGENSPNFKWSFQAIKEETRKHKTRTGLFIKNQVAYNVARKRDDYEELVSHMVQPIGSGPESHILELIKKIFPKAQKLMDRKASFPDKPHIHGFEIDVYIPELRKGIEFDGKYHHSFNGLKRGRPNWPEGDLKDYHQLKDRWFASKGIQILHIKEEDWNNDKEGCIKRCLDFLKILVQS